MNFLIRAAHPVLPEVSNVAEPENHEGVTPISNQTSTLEGLIAEDPFPSPSTGDNADTDSDVITDVGSSTPAPTSKNQGNHTDVLEDDGWITIPYSIPVLDDKGLFPPCYRPKQVGNDRFRPSSPATKRYQPGYSLACGEGRRSKEEERERENSEVKFETAYLASDATAL
ncbi:hypothetical protein GW17_00020827 [Ensete ventricosum]|nr:hypothetical protein GW17_00020827 [Ensete ventricosum]